jgi:tripartite-type tricarboxylate transporter receptor subunit TctC
MFKQSAQIDIVHVPYKSVAAAVGDVLSGQAQLMFSIAQGAVPHVQSGKLRALAITSQKRSQAVPDVPTMSEAGFADIDIVGWNGLSVPVKTPRTLVMKLNGDVRRILAQKDVQERMIAAGFDLADTTVDEFDAFVRKDVKLYQRIVKAAAIKLD